MSNEIDDLEDVVGQEVASDAVAEQPSDSEVLKEQLRQQSELVSKQASEMDRLREAVEALSSQRAAPQEEEQIADSADDDYVTGSALKKMHKKAVDEAEKRVLERMSRERLEHLNAQIKEPKTLELLKRILKADPLFESAVNALGSTDPIKARELLLSKVSSVRAKRAASVPPAPAGASGASSGAGVPNEQPDPNRVVRSINGASPRADLSALASTIYKQALNKP